MLLDIRRLAFGLLTSHNNFLTCLYMIYKKQEVAVLSLRIAKNGGTIATLIISSIDRDSNKELVPNFLC